MCSFDAGVQCGEFRADFKSHNGFRTLSELGFTLSLETGLKIRRWVSDCILDSVVKAPALVAPVGGGFKLSPSRRFLIEYDTTGFSPVFILKDLRHLRRRALKAAEMPPSVEALFFLVPLWTTFFVSN
jgi:hypothetical protein